MYPPVPGAGILTVALCHFVWMQSIFQIPLSNLTERRPQHHHGAAKEMEGEQKKHWQCIYSRRVAKKFPLNGLERDFFPVKYTFGEWKVVLHKKWY